LRKEIVNFRIWEDWFVDSDKLVLSDFYWSRTRILDSDVSCVIRKDAVGCRGVGALRYVREPNWGAENVGSVVCFFEPDFNRLVSKRGYKDCFVRKDTRVNFLGAIRFSFGDWNS